MYFNTTLSACPTCNESKHLCKESSFKYWYSLELVDSIFKFTIINILYYYDLMVYNKNCIA